MALTESLALLPRRLFDGAIGGYLELSQTSVRRRVKQILDAFDLLAPIEDGGEIVQQQVTGLHEFVEEWVPPSLALWPQVLERNLDRVEILIADKGYDAAEFREYLWLNDVRPVIKHRELDRSTELTTLDLTTK
jgi:hypothetical protein